MVEKLKKLENLMSKEERYRLATQKMEEMKIKNEQLLKRSKEVEADKQAAESTNSSVTAMQSVCYISREDTSEYIQHEEDLEIKQKDTVSLTKNSRKYDNNQYMSSKRGNNFPSRGYRGHSPRQFYNTKNSTRSNWRNTDTGFQQANNIACSSRGAVDLFSSGDVQDTKTTDKFNPSRIHPDYYFSNRGFRGKIPGRGRFYKGSVSADESLYTSPNSHGRDRSGSFHSRGVDYDRWKAERKTFDEQRLTRARGKDGGWRREWDNEKPKQGEVNDSLEYESIRCSNRHKLQLCDYIESAIGSDSNSYSTTGSLSNSRTEMRAGRSELNTNNSTNFDQCENSNFSSIHVKNADDNVNLRCQSITEANCDSLERIHLQKPNRSFHGVSGKKNLSRGVSNGQRPSINVTKSTTHFLVESGSFDIHSSSNSSSSCDSKSTNVYSATTSNETTELVEKIDTKESEKNEQTEYNSGISVQKDVGDEGFGFGEDCLAAEWYSSSTRREREGLSESNRNVAAKSNVTGRQHLWVIDDIEDSKLNVSSKNHAEDSADTEILSFEELLAQHREAQLKSHATEPETSAVTRRTGDLASVDGRVVKRAVRRIKSATPVSANLTAVELLGEDLENLKVEEATN